MDNITEVESSPQQKVFLPQIEFISELVPRPMYMLFDSFIKYFVKE